MLRSTSALFSSFPLPVPANPTVSHYWGAAGLAANVSWEPAVEPSLVFTGLRTLLNLNTGARHLSVVTAGRADLLEFICALRFSF